MAVPKLRTAKDLLNADAWEKVLRHRRFHRVSRVPGGWLYVAMRVGSEFASRAFRHSEGVMVLDWLNGIYRRGGGLR